MTAACAYNNNNNNVIVHSVSVYTVWIKTASDTVLFSLFVSVSCSEDRTGSQEGVLMSPEWPGPYPENSVCSYILAVEEGLQFELTFTGVFDVEKKENGECIDSLTVGNMFSTIFEPALFLYLYLSSMTSSFFPYTSLLDKNTFWWRWDILWKGCPFVPAHKVSTCWDYLQDRP